MAVPERIGDYVDLRPLSQGAMGVIYLGRHCRSGKLAAIKTVKGAKERHLALIRREVLALEGLDHPGIVRIRASGWVDGVPWYAMDYVEGDDLFSYCRRFWDPAALRSTVGGRPRFDLRSLLPLLRPFYDLTQALAYLHGEGLMHRDLKADNILVSSSGRAVLVDFGLQVRFAGPVSREEADTGLLLSAGTIPNMAPEQIVGELVDARADLYSLGCLLYRVLTGRYPFAYDEPRRVIIGHLREPPPRPDRFVEGIPAALTRLLARLLDKAVHRRIAYATDVGRTLLRVMAALGDRTAPPAPTRPYLYRAAFVGNQPAMAALRQRVDAAQRGDGGVAFVVGEAGIGKTRLAMEAARDARQARMAVISGTCRPQAAIPLGVFRPFLQAIADRCRERGETMTRDLLGPHGRVLFDVEPSLGTVPGVEELPHPPPLPPETARPRLFEALAHCLVAYAHHQPTLLLLDDFHWADQLSVAALAHLLQRLSEAGDTPLLIVPILRPEEMSAPLRELLEEQNAEAIHLERLDDGAVEELIGQMLAWQKVPRALLDYVRSQAEGLPFFVCEYLHALVSAGRLRRDERGQWQLDGALGPDHGRDAPVQATPQVVKELFLARLRSLSTEAEGLVRAAALLGRHVEEALLQAMVDMDEAAYHRALDEAVRRGIIEVTAEGPLRFLHDTFRRLLYIRVPLAERRALHGLAADLLQRGTDPAEVPWADIAQHWLRAGELERARDAYAKAAHRALDRFAHADAEALFDAYFALVEHPDEASLEARHTFALSILRAQGRTELAFDQLSLALEEARRIGSRHYEAEALRSLAFMLAERGEVDQALSQGTAALALFRELGDPAGEARALESLAAVYRWRGDMDRAIDLWTEAVRMHRRAGDVRRLAIAASNLGLVLRDAGRFRQARECLEEALGLHRKVGNVVGAGNVLGNLALLKLDQGLADDARLLFQSALDIHRRSGNKIGEGIALGNLAIIAYDEGKPAAAQAYQEAALEIYRQTGHRRYSAMILGRVAQLAHEQGRFEDAHQAYTRALGIHRDMGDALWEGVLWRWLARLDRHWGRPLEQVQQQLDRSREQARAAGDRVGMALTLCEQGHLELARNRSAEAILTSLRHLPKELGLGWASDLADAITRLSTAQQAWDLGALDQMYRGELIDDLGAGLRRRLEDEGLLSS